MITITAAPPYLAVQDRGRAHTRSAGVPRGGAMDVFALTAANTLVGNSDDAACLEWALGGGSLRFERDTIFSMAGATADVRVSGRPMAPLTTHLARGGESLVVERMIAGRFLYLGFAGAIDVPEILGSRSNYLPGGFGGYEGGMIRTGATIPLGPEPPFAPPPALRCPVEIAPNYSSDTVHVTRAPHADLFDDSAWQTFLEAEFRVSPASDRTGYRLDGVTVPHTIGTLPSEPGSFGSIQVPGDGKPIVLMADAPTVGGYPKIAVVSEADLPILSQRRPGSPIRFELITIEQSQRALRRRYSDLDALQRLARSNS